MKACLAILLLMVSEAFLGTRTSGAAALYSVTDLAGVYANGVNGSGQVVGSASVPAYGPDHAFLYSGGIMNDLGTLGGQDSYANAINDSGQVVGSSGISASSSVTHAFLYSGGMMNDLGALGGQNSYANGINNSGEVVGYYTGQLNPSQSYEHAFLYKNGAMTDIGTLHRNGVSFAHSINNSGQIVGGTENEAFLYDGTTMIGLGTLGGVGSEAHAINDSGQVVGDSQTYASGTQTLVTHAFLYSGGVMNDLGTFGGTNSAAYGINNSGQIVGSADSIAGTHAFVYSGGVMQDLNALINPFPETLYVGLGINNAGQIVAWGSAYNYFAGSVLLTPAPRWTGASSAAWAENGNWSGAVPGTTIGATSTDVALFNQNAPRSPMTIDAGRNIQCITFDTANVNSMTIGATGGNSLLLSSRGTIATTSTVTSSQTINAPLVLEGGNYTFTSDAISPAATLNFGGAITPGATSGTTTLTLNGANTGPNSISGGLADNGSGQLAIAMSGTGLWILSGNMTYSGGTSVNSGTLEFDSAPTLSYPNSIGVYGGTLRFNVNTGTATVGGGVAAYIASGATLELAGSVSALGGPVVANRVLVTNAGTLLVSGTNQQVGAIDGTGNVTVSAGGQLTADHIVQTALTIGGTAGSLAIVTIDASDSSGNPLGQPSGESSGLILAGSLQPNGPFPAGNNSASRIDGSARIGSTSVGTTLAPTTASAAFSSTVVPEPSSIVLFGLGCCALARLGFRRRNTAATPLG